MPWEMVRSRRDPAVWAPFALFALVAVPGLLLAQQWRDDWIGSLRALAESDPLAARIAAQRGIRTIAWAVGGLVVGFAAVMSRSCLLGLRQQRMPPAGWWSFGAFQVATGSTATRIARAGLGMALLLAALGIASPLLVERFLHALPAR
jgi:hypothetical protein